MASPSYTALRQPTALSSHSALRGAMDGIFDRRSLHSKQSRSRRAFSQKRAKGTQGTCHAEVGKMPGEALSRRLEYSSVMLQTESRRRDENSCMLSSHSDRNTNKDADESSSDAEVAHSRAIFLSHKTVSKSRRRSFSMAILFSRPYRQVVADGKQLSEKESQCARVYHRRGFSLPTLNSDCGSKGKSLAADVSLRRQGGDIFSLITTHSGTVDTGFPCENYAHFTAPLPTEDSSVPRSSKVPKRLNMHHADVAMDDQLQQGSSFKHAKQQHVQDSITGSDTGGFCAQKCGTNAEQGDENVDILKTIIPAGDVHLAGCRNTSENHSSSQHARRSSIRCSRQKQRCHAAREAIGLSGQAFERGTVQLRDSRRRTAEIMRQRRSQPDMSVHCDEQLLPQPFFHTATKVKFLNETKPTVMNKWIRAARTASSYANIAFEKSSNLAKRDIEHDKFCSLEQDKGDSITDVQGSLIKNQATASRKQDRKTKQEQPEGVKMDHSVREKGERVQQKYSTRSTIVKKICDAQESLQDKQSRLGGTSLNPLSVSKVFQPLNVMKEKYFLESIMYADSEPDSLSDMENITPQKSSSASVHPDGFRSSGSCCICHQEILQLYSLQEIGNLLLVNYKSDTNEKRSLNTVFQSANLCAVSDILEKRGTQNSVKNSSNVSEVDNVEDTAADLKSCSCATSIKRMPLSTNCNNHSCVWLMQLSKDERVSETFYANNRHLSLNDALASDGKKDTIHSLASGDLCDQENDDHHVGKLASSADETIRKAKRILNTDERGEGASAWLRPRGREVLATVGVKESISAQQCTHRPLTSVPTQALNATQQSDPPHSDSFKQSSLQLNHFGEDCLHKRKDRILGIKKHAEAQTACGKAFGAVTPEPSAEIPNPMTVQDRVNEAECESMANGEHTQASGLSSDRASSDVERILHNPVYRRPFQQFLEQQFCAENINFYVAVEEYRAIPDNEMERRSKVARQIYERHFTANSIEPVNIDNSTSRCIKDAVMAQRFSAQLYDVAQYQIFHLLKYDCWPRYLRAGGVAPNFDDVRGEEHPGPSTQPIHPSQQQSSDKKRKSLLWHGLKPRFSRRKKELRTMSSTHIYGSGGSPQVAETRSCGGVETGRRCSVEQLASSGTHMATASSAAVSPFCVGGQTARVTSGSPCSPQPCGSSDSIGDEQIVDEFSAADASTFARISWSGSKRRQRFTNFGKQFSVPNELSCGQKGAGERGSSSTSVSPNRSRQLASEVCTRFCTLMHNEIASSEQIPLSDPTESVGKWTSMMAAKRGMDPRATEAVDAQSLSTIDPARQAMDALNNRCVCLMPVLHFALEVLAPNASTKTGSSSNSRIVLLRARHGLSSGVVLRSVLAKFSVDYDACVVVVSGTLEVIASHISVGTVGSRCITVMTQQQFQERQHSPKREVVKDAPVSAHLLSPDANIPFFQHGDVAFFELPPDFDPRTGKMNAARSYSNAKTEHTSGFLKFVRKASQAVTSREQDAAAPSSSTHHAHHHSGHNQHSSSMTSSYADKIRRKSVGTFQRASSAAATSDIPYCGENNVSDEQYVKSTDKRPEAGASPEITVATGSAAQIPADGRGRVYELPDFLRKENCLDSSSVDASVSKLRYCAESVTTTGANGSATRIPPIYASAVPSEKDLTPCEVEKSIVWQPADYV